MYKLVQVDRLQLECHDHSMYMAFYFSSRSFFSLSFSLSLYVGLYVYNVYMSPLTRCIPFHLQRDRYDNWSYGNRWPIGVTRCLTPNPGPPREKRGQPMTGRGPGKGRHI
jgi:hypothetical protein